MMKITLSRPAPRPENFADVDEWNGVRGTVIKFYEPWIKEKPKRKTKKGYVAFNTKTKAYAYGKRADEVLGPKKERKKAAPKAKTEKVAKPKVETASKPKAEKVAKEPKTKEMKPKAASNESPKAEAKAYLDYNIGQAYEDLAGLPQFEDGIVPIFRLYHQVQYRSKETGQKPPTVDEFHQSLIEKFLNDNKANGRLMVLNEVRTAEEPEKAIRRGDNLYYYLLWNGEKPKRPQPSQSVQQKTAKPQTIAKRTLGGDEAGVQSKIEKAYKDLSQLLEYQSSGVPLPRVFHQLRQDDPSFNTTRFQSALNDLESQGRIKFRPASGTVGEIDRSLGADKYYVTEIKAAAGKQASKPEQTFKKAIWENPNKPHLPVEVSNEVVTGPSGKKYRKTKEGVGVPAEEIREDDSPAEWSYENATKQIEANRDEYRHLLNEIEKNKLQDQYPEVYADTKKALEVAESLLAKNVQKIPQGDLAKLAKKVGPKAEKQPKTLDSDGRADILSVGEGKKQQPKKGTKMKTKKKTDTGGWTYKFNGLNGQETVQKDFSNWGDVAKFFKRFPADVEVTGPDGVTKKYVAEHEGWRYVGTRLDIPKVSRGEVFIDGQVYRAFENSKSKKWYIVKGRKSGDPIVKSAINAKSAKGALESWMESRIEEDQLGKLRNQS